MNIKCADNIATGEFISRQVKRNGSLYKKKGTTNYNRALLSILKHQKRTTEI
jgi:hypothetical protein